MNDSVPVNIEVLRNEREERELNRRAGQWSDFGTLTSLGTTGAWIIESVISPGKLPKPVIAALILPVAVGVGSIIYSCRLRAQAGKLAHANEQALERELASAQTGVAWTSKHTDAKSNSPAATLG